ncbi:hypothetical protein EMGBS4_19860 [Acidimicrobiaceae bacterium]|nr:hypothetical protein EMGBS4_19860 [Acidimicrobiaceae bacterium]
MWLLVVYVGSLALLVVSAFFGLDEFTGKATTNLTIGNIEEVISESAYRLLVLRSIGLAGAATVICFMLALPVGFIFQNWQSLGLSEGWSLQFCCRCGRVIW